MWDFKGEARKRSPPFTAALNEWNIQKILEWKWKRCSKQKFNYIFKIDTFKATFIYTYIETISLGNLLHFRITWKTYELQTRFLSTIEHQVNDESHQREYRAKWNQIQSKLNRSEFEMNPLFGRQVEITFSIVRNVHIKISKL